MSELTHLSQHMAEEVHAAFRCAARKTSNHFFTECLEKWLAGEDRSSETVRMMENATARAGFMPGHYAAHAAFEASMAEKIASVFESATPDSQERVDLLAKFEIRYGRAIAYADDARSPRF